MFVPSTSSVTGAGQLTQSSAGALSTVLGRFRRQDVRRSGEFHAALLGLMPLAAPPRLIAGTKTVCRFNLVIESKEELGRFDTIPACAKKLTSNSLSKLEQLFGYLRISEDFLFSYALTTKLFA